MTGIYLRCDRCGATLGGEQVTNNAWGLHPSCAPVLQRAARELGWTGPLTRESDSDLCPECSKRTVCEGCKKEIDPGVCWCGIERENHVGESHAFAPMGCDCMRAPKEKT